MQSVISNNPCSTIFVEWEADPVGLILGTGFMHFSTWNGMDGLARIRMGRLEVLSLYADVPGTGTFRTFVKECKSNFNYIVMWEIWNPWLGCVLHRYGFTPMKEVIDGETLSGMEWKK